MPGIIVILIWVIALYHAWSIGANDETTAPVVSGRTLTVNQAVIIGSIVGTLGGVFLSSGVQETIGTGFLNEQLTEEYMILILLTSSLWLTVISYFGISVSTTHATIGSLIGIGAITTGLSAINWNTITTMIIGWIVSMILGFSITYIGTKAIVRLKDKYSKPEKFEQICTKLLIVSTILLQLCRWGNDIGNASGIIYSLTDPLITRLISAVFMSFGLIVLGRIVLGNVGGRLVALTPSAALISQVVATPLIFTFAFLGIPLSGTHVMVTSMIGGGIALKTKVDTKLVRSFAIAWILSFIIPALMTVLFAVIGSSAGILSLQK